MGETIWNNNYLYLKGRIEHCTTPEERERMISENGPALDAYEASGLKVAKDINDIRYKQGMASVVLSQAEANKQMSLVIKEEHSDWTEQQVSDEFTRRVQGIAHGYGLSPTNPAFIDAILSPEDEANDYGLEYNDNNVLWRITPSRRVHPDDLVKYQQQLEYKESISDNLSAMSLGTIALNKINSGLSILDDTSTALTMTPLPLLEATRLGGKVVAFGGKGIIKIGEAILRTEKVTEYGKNIVKGVEETSRTAKSGEFNILNWEKYPEKFPKPEGPFRILKGTEYEEARAAANKANRAIHASDPSLKGM